MSNEQAQEIMRIISDGVMLGYIIFVAITVAKINKKLK